MSPAKNSSAPNATIFKRIFVILLNYRLNLLRNPYLHKALIFFVAGILSLAVATFFSWQSKIGSEKNEEIIRDIASNISDFCTTSNVEYEQMKAAIEGGNRLKFGDLNASLQIPVTVFEDEMPIYWSKQALVYDFSSIAMPFKVKVVKANTGITLLVRKAFLYRNHNYIFIYQLWLAQRYAIKNNFVKSGLNRSILPHKVSQVSLIKELNNVFLGQYFLFSVGFTAQVEQPNRWQTAIIFGLFGCFLVLSVIALVNVLKYVSQKKILIWAWFVLAIINSGLVFYLYYFKLSISKAAVFQWLDYHLMFELVASFSVLLLLYLPFRNILGNASRMNVFAKADRYGLLIDCVALVSNAALLQVLLLLSKAWYKHPFYSFNIFNIGSYTSEKLITLLILVIYGLIYFMFSHLIAKYLLRRVAKKGIKLMGIWSAAAVLLASLSIYIYGIEGIAASIASIYLLISVWQGWPSTLNRPRYVTYLYLFFCIFIIGVAVTTACYVGEKELSVVKSKRWAEKINREAGVIDFQKLKSVSDSLKLDTLLRRGLQANSSDLELVEQNISKYYIADQFGQYESNIYLFDKEGICLNKTIKPYFYYLSNYSKPKFRTRFRGIYKVTANSTNYYCFIPISGKMGLLGYVILEFKLRRLIPNSILPALFKEQIAYWDDNDYKPDFAIYKSNLLVSEGGKMNLQKQLPLNISVHKNRFLEGKFDLSHYMQLFDFHDSKSIMIVFPASIIKIFVSNFSFVFAIFSGVLAIFIFSNTFYFKLRQVSTTFTTKIQLFINIAFFLPLVAVSVASFSIMNNVFKTDLEKSYNEKAGFVSQNLSIVLSKFNQNKLSIGELSEELERTAKYVQSDIVLYDVAGKMLLNTQPSLFDLSLLPIYISPIAYSDISERKESTAILDELIGKFQYKAVYSAIKSYDSGVLLGFVSIPFFESDFIFKEKVMDSITTILNIFILIFILFLGTTYFFSSRLTLPLTMLTQKIKYTSLEKNNEPLFYDATDEIGILVKEYNRMLKKLEENKKVLASSEKESAWREMAKQVAHEIKNPLTPMKLALQNMQRMLKTDRIDKEEIALRSADVLLEQIENLNEIAGSFFSFAQMPSPKKEKVELSKLIENVVFLFQSESKFNINFRIDVAESMVLGDEKMISRIMINLLRNAIESVKEGMEPSIAIELSSLEDKVEVKIADNGTGISEVLGAKIFQPNFSTKSSGSGIGLALAKRGLEQMGGNISFTSKLGVGSTFSIRLPKA